MKKQSKPVATKNSTNSIVWLCSAICGVFALLLYANTLGHQWALDDFPTIYGNAVTQQGFDGISTLLKTSYWYGLDGKNDWLYRPMSMIMFAIEWELAPNNPILGHWINVLMYGLTGFFLFRFMKNLFEGKNILLPFAITLLFVAHPIHTEVVANIKSRDEILTFLFSILTLNQILQYIKAERMISLALAFLFFLIASFSKESAISILGVVPVMIYFFSNSDIKKYAYAMLPVMAAAGIYLIARGNVLTSQTAQEGILISDNSLVATSNVGMQKATAIYIMGLYLKLLVFPHPMSCDYSYNEIKIVGFDNWFVIVSILLHLGMGVYALMGIKKKDPVSFGIIFYLGTIILVTNLFFLTRSTMADRFLYMPSLGFCIALIVLLSRLLKIDFSSAVNFPSIGNMVGYHKAFTGIIGVLLLIASVKTFARNQDWENDTTIFSSDAEHAPGSARIHYLYGNHFLQDLNQNLVPAAEQEEHWQIAVRELKRSIECHADYLESYMGLGDCYVRKSMFKEALDIYSAAIKRNPNFGNAYNNLGNCYFKMGQYDNAIAELTKAVTVNPQYSEGFNNLGSAYFAKQDFNNAIAAFNKAISIAPSYSDAYKNLGSTYGTMGQLDQAIGAFLKGLEYKPNDATINYYLGITYNNKGDAMNGNRYLNRAYELDPKLRK
ncbi:MAG: tetratricopeptide repeat protein [Bacteroidetes bacterium]|nr:tetratricopeptide repeat protein [Bacteroidota bacterium]